RPVGADHIARRGDADDVPPGQRALIDARRGDPDIALRIPDGEVAAGGGGEALVIDPLHKHDDLICRVYVRSNHNATPKYLCFLWIACDYDNTAVRKKQAPSSPAGSPPQKRRRAPEGG